MATTTNSSCLIVLFGFSNGSDEISSDEENEVFSKLDAEEYVLYYPNYFITSTSNWDEFYTSPDSETFIGLSIEEKETLMKGEISDGICIDILFKEGIEDRNDILSYNTFSSEKYIGCEYTQRLFNILIINRTLWYTAEDDKRFFAIVATIYLDKSSDEEQELLKEAVEMFQLK